MDDTHAIDVVNVVKTEYHEGFNTWNFERCCRVSQTASRRHCLGPTRR
jgi:hypothetical protein